MSIGGEFFMLTKKGKLQKIWFQLAPQSETFLIKDSEKGKIKEQIPLKTLGSIRSGHTTTLFRQYAETG